MTNNEILLTIRDTFDLNDAKIIDIFSQADYEVTHDQLDGWFKKEFDSSYQACSDTQLTIFLNGLINDKRGKKEGAQPKIEKVLTNNIVFVKLKIALDLRADDILDIMTLVKYRISKHELSSLFRKPGHKHYRGCKDQVLNKFLKGVKLKYSPTP